MCAAAPSHVRRAVTLAIPHPATLLRSLASSKQWKKSWYMVLFKLPGADYLVGRRKLALILRLLPHTAGGQHQRSSTAFWRTSDAQMMLFWSFEHLDWISPRPVLFVAGDHAH
ncbi:MAG: hypothetical protein L0Z50_29895 [Verrucomicrobiales bacterium]|nr:hypothetical protein [Verrucomicrobiales bacterium]